MFLQKLDCFSLIWLDNSCAIWTYFCSTPYKQLLHTVHEKIHLNRLSTKDYKRKPPIWMTCVRLNEKFYFYLFFVFIMNKGAILCSEYFSVISKILLAAYILIYFILSWYFYGCLFSSRFSLCPAESTQLKGKWNRIKNKIFKVLEALVHHKSISKI